MIKDSNEKIDVEIDDGRQLNKINLEKNNIYKDINISNISTKETTEISSETEESYNGNKPQKKNEIKKEIKNKTKENDMNLLNKIKEKRIKEKKMKKKLAINESYKSEFISKKNNMNIKAPKIPINFDIIFDIDNNSKQKEIGDKEYIKDINYDKYNKNKDIKEISVISHDKLLHLITNEQKNENYNKVCITERLKHKFLTTIYLFPKK